MTDSLLATKFHIPLTRTALVDRQRLSSRLEEGLRGRLVLISAPAGFGKTTLLVSFLAVSVEGVAWLSLDADDNHEGRFLRYLAAALQNIDGTIGQDALRTLSAPQPVQPQAVLTGLVNDISASGLEIILVLDDYHLISNQTVHQALAFLLEYGPQNLHFILATRSDPPLPLSRLRARGQLAELRAADLRFTGEEAADFLNDVMGLRLDAGDVAALESRTEGWIAGLQMAALSMRNREDVSGFIEGFSGTNRFILDYLLEEVLVGQPPIIQQFLLRTSVLDRLTEPLCAVLLDTNNFYQAGESPAPNKDFSAKRISDTILDQLERDNIFLVPLDEQRTWFRYHHLFADLLRARLKQTSPEIVPYLHNQAADWLEAHGQYRESVQHLISAQDLDRAVELIAMHGPKNLMANDPLLLQMAEKLPVEKIIGHPRLGLYQIWQLITRGQIQEAQVLLKRLGEHLSQAGADAGCRWKKTITSLARLFLFPASASEENVIPDVTLLEEIPPDEPILQNAAEYLYVMTLARQGEMEKAAFVAQRFLQQEQRRPGASAVPTLAPFLTRIYLMLGRLKESAALCRMYLDPLADKDGSFYYASGNMKIDLGEVLYEWNRLEEAEAYIRDGLQANKPWGNIMTEGFGLVVLVRLLQAKGDYTSAQEELERFEVVMKDPSRPHEFDGDLLTLRTRLQLASGDLEAASRWADEVKHDGRFELHCDYYRLTFAHIRLKQGRYTDTESLLKGTTPPEPVGSWIASKLESDLVLAAAAAGQGRLPEAFDLLEDCLAAAEPEGYIRVFLDAGKPVEDLLTACLRERSTACSDFAWDLLKAFTNTNKEFSCQPNGRRGKLVEPLSDRELEVLEIIALGCTNQEIARRLVIAKGTVKAHTASIYRKLDVANRTEAVARARSFGLIN